MIRHLRNLRTAVINKMTTNDSNSIHHTPPLTYKVTGKCSTTKARIGIMSLRHIDVNTPVFMPVGTQVNSIVH